MTVVTDEKTTLYRAFNSYENLLYVGIARNWGRRWAQHSERAPWFPEVARVHLTTYPSRSEALDAEREAITVERPLHNVVHARFAGRRASERRRPRPRMTWQIRSFDHRFAADLPEYHTAAQAISDLANALGQRHLGGNQEQYVGMLSLLGWACVYGDYCDRCAVTAFPVAVELDQGGKGLVASYQHTCGHRWTCSWAVDVALLAP